MQNIFRIFLVLLLLTTLTACLSVQDGDGEKANAHPTLGQELIDLKKARDVGAISGLEYKEFKEILKESYQ